MTRHDEANSDAQLLIDRTKLEHDARNQIRKQSLDPYNRLHSIAEDIDFVQKVHDRYSNYPLIANLRCGAWYCDSRTAGGLTAHFKSADGHYNGWSFNLRRPNLHILPLIQGTGGVCLVDSTRSGKRMPDSLSKTVPIWCSVINRALKLRRMLQSDIWDVQLYTAPQSVSRQEHAQIESRIDGWSEALAKSTYALPSLNKPLRPIWITPATTEFPVLDKTMPFFPVVCISASQLIEDATERRRRGYSYVQGAGDDHENWSQGLTPDIFWEHKDELLEASEIDFTSILERIVFEGRSVSRSLKAVVKTPTPISRIGGLLSISRIEDLSGLVYNRRSGQTPSSESTPCIIIRTRPDTSDNTRTNDASLMQLLCEIAIPDDKKAGERAFKACLPLCLDFIRQHISEKRQVCIACETGQDLSVGVALVALQAFFDDNGALDLDRFDQGKLEVTKESLRTRLHWIIASRPEADPSRATLKRINEFFMSPRRGHA